MPIDSNRFAEKRPMRGPGIGGGNLRAGYAFADVPAGAAVGETIRFLGIPANATVYGMRLRATGAVTLNLGDPANPTRFANAQAVAANATPTEANQPEAFGYTYPQAGQPGATNKNVLTGTLTVSPVAAARVHVFATFTVQEP